MGVGLTAQIATPEIFGEKHEDECDHDSEGAPWFRDEDRS